MDYWAIDDVLFHPALVAAVGCDGVRKILQWNALPGSTGYVVRSAADLAPGAWSEATTLTGTVWTNTLPGATRFFNVEAKLPDSDL